VTLTLYMPVGHDVMPPFVVPNGQGVTAKSGPGLTRVVVFGHHGLHQKHGLSRSLERARFLLVAQAAVHRIAVDVKASSRSREEFGSGLVITDVGYHCLLSIRG
jgi:hypothetical protein